MQVWALVSQSFWMILHLTRLCFLQMQVWNPSSWRKSTRPRVNVSGPHSGSRRNLEEGARQVPLHAKHPSASVAGEGQSILAEGTEIVREGKMLRDVQPHGASL